MDDMTTTTLTVTENKPAAATSMSMQPPTTVTPSPHPPAVPLSDSSKEKLTFSRRRFYRLSKDREEMLLKSNEGRFPSPPSKQRSDSLSSSLSVQTSSSGKVDDISVLKKLQKQQWNELPWDLFIDEHVTAQTTSDSPCEDKKLKENDDKNEKIDDGAVVQCETTNRNSAYSMYSEETMTAKHSFVEPSTSSSSSVSPSIPSPSSMNVIQHYDTSRPVRSETLPAPKRKSFDKIHDKGLSSRRTRRRSSLKSVENFLATTSKSSFTTSNSAASVLSSKSSLSKSSFSEMSPMSSMVQGFEYAHDTTTLTYSTTSNGNFYQMQRSISVTSDPRSRTVRQSSTSSIQSASSSVSVQSANSSLHGGSNPVIASNIVSAALSPSKSTNNAVQTALKARFIELSVRNEQLGSKLE